MNAIELELSFPIEWLESDGYGNEPVSSPDVIYVNGFNGEESILIAQTTLSATIDAFIDLLVRGDTGQIGKDHAAAATAVAQHLIAQANRILAAIEK